MKTDDKPSPLLREEMKDVLYDNITPYITPTLPVSDVSGLFNSGLFKLSWTCRELYDLLQNHKRNAILAHLAHFTVVEPNETKLRQVLGTLPLNELQKILTQKISQVEIVIDEENDIKRVLRDNTLLQLAYGDKDTEMYALYQSYFEKAFGCEPACDIMQKQLAEKFTEASDFEERDKQIKVHLAALLRAVIAAITHEPFNRPNPADKIILSAATLQAIKIFREEFAKTQPRIIDKGFHFRDETLQEVLDTYASATQQWNDLDNRSALFEEAVLSAVLSYVPENDKQRFNQGLYYTFSRRVITQDGYSFRGVLSMESLNFVFPHACVDIVFGTVAYPYQGNPSAYRFLGMARCAEIFKTYVEQKHQIFHTTSPLPQESDGSVPRLVMRS